MKLRVRGQSLRLRLTHEEVQALAATGHVEERLWLAADRALAYRVSIAPAAHDIGVRYQGEVIEVELPAAAAHEWCAGEAVTLAGSQPVGSRILRITVEKDFDSSD